MKINTLIQWIESDVGGRKVRPDIGARFNIIWQKKLASVFNDPLWTVQLTNMEHIDQTILYKVELEFGFLDGEELSSQEIFPGNLFELIDGFRIVGVGKVC